MRRLIPLVEKEVKDLLRDPRIYIGLLVPVIMLPLLGSIMSMALGSSTEVSLGDVKITVLDKDETVFSKLFLRQIENIGVGVETISAADIKTGIEKTKGSGSKTLIVVEKGFEESLNNFQRANIKVYAIVESTGLGFVGTYSTVRAILDMSSRVLSDMLISQLSSNVSPDAVREPLNITVNSVVKDKIFEVDPQILLGQIMMGYNMTVPMLLFILSITVVQIAATATAVENEEKTLETLLTFPVTRYEILLAKLLGSSILAIIGGVLFTVGFIVYFQSMLTLPRFTGSLTGAAQPIPSPLLESFILLAISLIISILFITSLGVVIGALSSDVRMSNSLLGVVIIPVMIPLFIIMYGDPKTMPLALQLLVYALPTSYPMIIAKEMAVTSIPFEALLGVPYSVILTILVLYATSMLLAPEKLLTLQHRLKLSTFKKTKRSE